jgi:phosphate transport system permease protein
VFGAIYTAYFMTARMRRVVKPSIELMEALPTVIIGFLAGLWFAPIVERHLASVIALMLFLPISTIVVGAIWHKLPKAWVGRFPNGWHAVILMPVIALLAVGILSQSGNIEQWFFAGDVRVFLAEQGIDFDQRNALVVGFAMGFAVIPTIFTIAEDAIFSVPKHLSDGSLALGATPWQTLIHVVLLTASPGIFSAIMMGLGRAVGETMIVLMATGNTPIMDWNILEGMRTLSATIAVEMPESEVGSSHYRILFLAALILLVFTFAVNSVAEWVRQRLREKYRAL